MIYGLLLTLFVLMCFFMILIIMVQQSKGSMGLGSLGGSAQMLFGGTGGQDLFQKITWTCGALFMFGSLVLTLMKSHELNRPTYLVGTAQTLQQPVGQSQTAPITADQLPLPEAE